MTLAIKINTFQAVGNAALAGAGGGGGLLWWLGNYSAGLGVIAVFIVALTGIAFKYAAYRELKRHHAEIEGRRRVDIK